MSLKTILILSLCLGASFACKQKKTVSAAAPAESSAPLLKSDIWQGTSDQIDPQLGKIKSLD